MDPKLSFWCVSYYLGTSGPFGYLARVGAKRSELVQKFVPRSLVRIFRHECTRSNQLDPKLTVWCVLYHLGASRSVCLSYETCCKTGRTSAKVRATMSHRTFRNECTRSTPLDPKLTFWCISYHLGTFGTVWLPYKTRCKTGRTSANVRATKSRQNFSQRTHPIHPIGP